MGKLCGQKLRNRTDGKRCAKPAGWGTDHLGSGSCKLHGGSSVTPNIGNQHARKHGIYSKLFPASKLNAAADMQGSVEAELTIARCQLLSLIEYQHKYDSIALIDSREVKTIESESPEDELDRVKTARAKDAAAAGEWYDPNEDDQMPANGIQIVEVKTVRRRRDFNSEYIRLTSLVASLERTQQMLQHGKIVTAKLKDEIKRDGDSTQAYTDTELDNAILSLVEGLPAPVPR